MFIPRIFCPLGHVIYFHVTDQQIIKYYFYRVYDVVTGYYSNRIMNNVAVVPLVIGAIRAALYRELN